MIFSYVPDYIPPQPPPGGYTPLPPADEGRKSIGKHLTRAGAREARIRRDARDLRIALGCIRLARGDDAMRLVLDAMRKSRRERAAVLRDARRHPFWPLVSKWGAP